MFVLLLLTPIVEATTARVLLDQEKPTSTVQGKFHIQCLSWRQKKQLRILPCHQADQKNSKSSYRWQRSYFELQSQRQNFALVLSNQRVLSKVYAQGLRITGEFLWQGHAIQQLDIVRNRGKLEYIIYLPLETYLKGVLGSEVPASWPAESLKAQAIASRTYFLWKQRQSASYFDVRSDHMDQVFKMQEKVSPAISRAIEQTRGQILVTPSSRDIFPAYFHSDCGGHTSQESAVWHKDQAKNHAVSDPVCRNAKRNHWHYSIAIDQMMLKLHKKFLLPRDSELLGIFPRGNSEERAFELNLLFSNNLIKKISANEFRSLFGFGKIKSTQFYVTKSLNGFNFRGRGYGHGVGMCQWGAKRWAVRGRDYRAILKHYYQGAELVTSEERVRSLAGQAE